MHIKISKNAIRQLFTVEEKIESSEYDLANLLVSAGGNLGLFLGFSCLSVLFFVIDFLPSFFKVFKPNDPKVCQLNDFSIT